MKRPYCSSDWLLTLITLCGVAWAAVSFRAEPRGISPEVTGWLESLRSECMPGMIGNDYERSSSTQPTERRRMNLLALLHSRQRETAQAVKELQPNKDEEFRQMLALARLSAADEKSVLSACRLMAWSGYPAVRICAARLLRNLKQPTCAEWFRLALNDDRVVMNNGCGLDGDGRLYPVRLIAELALRDLGLGEGEAPQGSR